MASVVERAKATFAQARKRSPLLDHVIRMQQHYGRVNGGAQAGGITYYAFLAFFPIMALAFFVVGYVARVYPAARDNLVQAIEQVLPGIVGSGSGEIPLASLESAAGTAGLIGVVGLLYSGLGWLSGMRTALEVTFDVPRKDYPSFVVAKARDLVALVVIGLTLVVSVAISGAVAGFSTSLLDLVGAGHDLSWLVQVLGPLVGLASNMLLFFVMFRLLADPPTPRRALWQGSALGAVGFEALKQASSYLLASTASQPAFKVVGISLILLVWINYFSRLVLYAASWARTSAEARAAALAAAAADPARPVQGPQVTDAAVVRRDEGTAPASPARARDSRLAFGAGAATMLGAVAALRRRRHR